MAGRPRIYETEEELQAAVDSYFMQEVPGQTQPIPIQKPTVTGLALHLGFADKTTLYEYRDRPELSYPIKRALTRIEQYHEENLDSNSVAGRIFALKNMGWRDKVETGLTDKEGNDVQPQLIFQPAANCKPITDEPGNPPA